MESVGERTMQTPAATSAQRRYLEALKQARTVYAAELDPALKSAMTAGSLEDANAINKLKGRLERGEMPSASAQTFTTPRAKDARSRFENSVAAAQRQYGVELQSALKAAMSAGNLDDANAIDSELKALSATARLPAVAAIASTPPPLGVATAGRSATGLTLTRYPMHPSQTDGNKSKGYVPYTELGKPLAAPRTIRSVSSWSKEIQENAVVAGLLRIDQPGTYEFRSTSDWDRNELIIDGKIVCKFRDGEKKTNLVELRAGVVPIVSVAYAHATKDVQVQWKPPGAAEFSDIPSNLFSH